MPERDRRIKRPVEGRPHSPQSRVCHALGPRSSEGTWAYATTTSRKIWNSGPGRHQGKRRCRVGTRNYHSIHGDIGHLQQCSRSPLSTLGGGGNRTRVLQYLTRASPGAACSAFLSPGDHASETPTGSATV